MYERGEAIFFVLSRLTCFIVIFKTEFAVIHSVVQHNNSAAPSFTSVSAPAVTDRATPDFLRQPDYFQSSDKRVLSSKGTWEKKKEKKHGCPSRL